MDKDKRIMKPAKEYYTKDEKGEYIKIGESDKEETTITVDGFDFKLKNDEILKGEELEKVTQQEMVEELIKNEVEKSLGDGKRVTGISKVVDLNFLRELEKQCGYDKKEESLWDRASLVSTILRSSTSIVAIVRSELIIRLFLEFRDIFFSFIVLPFVSLGSSSSRLSKLPKSLQPISAGTTLARLACSITA